LRARFRDFRQPGFDRRSNPAPDVLDNFYGTLGCAVDADGNEVAGVRLPPIAAPLGTYTAWNIYRAQPCELCDRDGSLIPFARTKTERDAAGGPRRSPGTPKTKTATTKGWP
jgi:hypothetical protein